LLHPSAAVGVLEVENGLQRPMEMVGEKGYLLVQRLERVA
jgi:hypothetical protein